MPGESQTLLKEPFVVDDSKLNIGLRGFPVGTCLTSAVSATEGVSYVGYPIADLADLPCEDVIYLLFHKELPTPEQATTFREDLRSRQTLPDGVLDALKAMPRQGHPMEWFIAGLMLLGMTGKSEGNDYREDALDLVARTSGLVAAIFRIHEGWGEPVSPPTEQPFHEAFAAAMGAPDASPVLPELLRLFYVLHADHGGGNLSTFTGKAVASGLADVYTSMAGAMASLYGPRHGRANQECLAFVRECGSSDPEAVERFVREKLEAGEVIYGFGHAVLRAEDPRARIQYAFAEENFADDANVRTALALRSIAPRVIQEVKPQVQNPYPNVDAVSGSLLNAAGLRDPEFYTLLFGWSRVAGIAAQIVDERTELRDGRGVPIYRPRYLPERQTSRRR